MNITIIKPTEEQLSKYKGFLRGGNTGYCNEFGQVVADSNSTCLRVVLLRHYKVEAPLDFRAHVTFGIGHSIETAFENFYLKDKFEYEKEYYFLEEITDKVANKLAIDFLLTENRMPIELKSVSSTSTYEKVFVQNKPKTENVIQLTNYLISLEVQSGVLYYINTVYHSHKGTKNAYKAAAGEIKKFLVDINEDGMILINKENTLGINISGIFSFKDLAAKVIEEDIIHKERPLAAAFSPCNLCFFKDLCDSFDNDNFSTNEFIDRAKQLTTSHKGE